jgi:hypothetical protein
MKEAIIPERKHDVTLILEDCKIRIWIDENVEAILHDNDGEWDSVRWDMDEAGVYYWVTRYDDYDDDGYYHSKEYYKTTCVPQFEEVVKEAIMNKEIFGDTFENYIVDLRPDRYGYKSS